jgi:hypothetical protein
MGSEEVQGLGRLFVVDDCNDLDRILAALDVPEIFDFRG